MPRPRLIELLDRAVRVPLTMVVSPAGTGKTSLLSEWATVGSESTAWLSLDAADRDVVNFWSSVIASLETVRPGSGRASLAMLRRPASRGGAVDQLLADLEEQGGIRTVLVIDDFHVVDEEPAVVNSMIRFVGSLPPWLHLVIISRRALPLSVALMRSRAQILEIRFDDLRFSADEAAEVLHRLTPALTDDRVDAAVDRADGWVAGLQLAALAARAPNGVDSGGPNWEQEALEIQDYVVNEVLANEAADVFAMLSAAAVVPRINASLGRAMTGLSDAAAILRRAEARGLFITRLGISGWYDLHALVRTVLTAELESRSPTRLADLRIRAARWFEQAGEVVAALDAWILAGQPREALRLLAANHGRLYDGGLEAVVQRTIAAIPPTVATGTVEAMVEYAWCHLLMDRRRFLELVDQLEWRAERFPPSVITGARIKTLRASAAVMSGRWSLSGQLNREVLRDLGDGWRQDFLCRFAANGIAREIALDERWDDGSDEVRSVDVALTLDPERHLAFRGTQTVGAALAGRPLDAIRLSAGVRNAAAIADMVILRTELEFAEAVANRELGDRERAMAALEALADGPPDLMLFCRVLAMCELVRAHVDDGDVDTATRVFADAQSRIGAASLGRDARNWLSRTGTVLSLAVGDHEAAQRWADAVDDPFWTGVAAARVLLAAGERPAAMAVLETATPRCVRHEVVLGLLAARAEVDRERALKHATSALELASSHGLLQTVATEGSPVFELIEQAAWRAPAEWLDRLRRLVVGQTAVPARTDLALIEPLTQREQDVLRFLPSRLTVREIADELYVSVNTVKFHLRIIYRKLGVSSRAEAADVVRRMKRS